MKLLKSTLFIMALCLIQPVSAKVIKGKQPIESQATPVESPVVAPVTPPAGDGPSAPSKTSFQYLLNRIRNGMASEFIINDQGVFGQKFQDMIKSSDLAPELMEALLQAGRNLHLPLSGNNNQDLATVDYAQDNINRLITQQATPTAPAQADIIPAFYNTKTNLFNQDYLDRHISSDASLTTIPQKDAERMVIRDLMPKIMNAWKTRGIPSSPGLVDAVQKQIIRTIEKEFKKWGTPQAATSQKEWYDGWDTKLLNTQYLDKFVGDALRLRKPKRQYENELETLEKQVKNEWETEGIIGQAKDELAPLLNKQLEETANAIEQKRALKRGVMKELEIKAKQIKSQPQSTKTTTQSVPAKQPMGTTNDFDSYIRDLTAKNESEVLDSLFERMKSGFYAFKNKGSNSTKMINDMKEHLENEFPGISPIQIISAITYGIRAGLKVKLSPDPKQLLNFVSDIVNTQVVITPQQPTPAQKMTPREYALALGKDKYADEIKPLFIEDEKGAMTLDTFNKDFEQNFNKVVTKLSHDIETKFQNINRSELFKALQAPLGIYFNLDTPIIEYNKLTDALNKIV